MEISHPDLIGKVLNWQESVLWIIYEIANSLIESSHAIAFWYDTLASLKLISLRLKLKLFDVPLGGAKLAV